MPLRTLLLIVVLAAPGAARGQEAGFSLLRLGSDAAAGALGNAQVASSQGAFATYWNPAGLTLGPPRTAAFSHQIWGGDARTYTVAARFRAGPEGGFGLLASALTSGELEGTSDVSEGDATSGIQFASATVAFGRHVVGPLRAGLAAKVLREAIGIRSAFGYAVDVGVQADMLAGTLRLGAAFQNVGRIEALNDTATPLPRRLRGGLAVTPLRIVTEDDGEEVASATLLAEVVRVFEPARTQVHLGLAVTVSELVTTRVGYITDDTLRNFSAGLGLVFDPLVFDYAFIPLREGFGTAHALTLLYNW